LIWPRLGAEAMAASLRQRGILVRSMAGKPLIDGALRVSVGTLSQMQQFWNTYGAIEGLAGPLEETEGEKPQQGPL